MVKIGSKDLGIDDACNLYVGAGAVVNGLIWIFKPSKVHEQTIKGPSSKSLTRIGGTALLHIGATHIATGLSGDSPRSKQQLRIAAGQYAVLAALAARQWNGGEPADGEMRDDRIKGATVTSAVTGAVLAWRGLSAASDGTLTRYPA